MMNDKELDEELRSHLEMDVAQRMAGGASRADAEAAARRQFGNVTHVAEVTRDMWGRQWVDHLQRDIAYALRSLRRSPGFTTVVVLALALGIGVNSAIFSIVNGVMIRPLPYRDADRIVVINEGLPKMGPGMSRIAAAELIDYRELEGKVFQTTAIYEARSFTVRSPDGSLERVPGALVSGNFLRVLGREPMLGRTPETWTENAANPSASPAASEVIVSYSFWNTRLGGDSSIIGKTMPFGNGVATVAGVMPANVQFPIGGIGVTPADVFALYALTPQTMARRGDNYGTWAFGRLADGVSVERASAAVSTVASNLPRRYPDFYHGGTSIVIGGVSTLRDAIVGPVRRPLLILLGAVCLVLLIACLNVSSLLIARSVARQREIAIRRAIGASRSRLAQQFLTESLVLVAMGGVAGLVVGRYGALLLTRLDPNGSFNGYEIGLDWRVVGATVVVTALTGILFSMLPGLAGGDDLQTSLREADTQRKSLTRSGLVIAEIAIALLLTVGSGLMLRSFLHLRDVGPGFNADHLLTFRVSFPQSRYPTYAAAMTAEQALAQRLAAIPGVNAVSSATDIPVTGGSLIAFTPDPALGPPPQKVPIAAASLAQPGYFEAMGIKLRSGRTFSASDTPGSEPVAIIGETLAKQHFGGAKAVGRRI
jgi:putative ABC transport system permease protein